MEESLIDNSKPTTDSCDMQGQNPWLKEVKTTGHSFIKRGIAPVGIAVLPQQLPVGMAPAAYRQQSKYFRQNQQDQRNE